MSALKLLLIDLVGLDRSGMGRTQNEVHREFQRLVLGFADRNEIMAALYLCVTRFDNKLVFEQLLSRNNFFQDIEPDWCVLFSTSNIFNKL